MAIFFPLFIVALSLLTASADVNYSIDCGSSESSIDNNLISWKGDDSLINTGDSKSVATSYLFSSSDPSFVLNTLRVFPSGTKNCYIFDGEKGTKVSLRAMFFYGNYDGKSSPPSFGLQFDGNDWATVQTTLDTDSYLYYDVIYVTKGGFINVCLVQTNPNQIPFISALEVRTLDPTMYTVVDSGNALFLMDRLTLSTTAIRSSDSYDRMWQPVSITAGGSFTRLTYDGISIDTSTAPEKPPEDALKNALSTLSTSDQSLNWTLSELPSNPFTGYFIMYFSEMTQLDSTQKRAFSVYLDDALVKPSEGLVPPYGGVTELRIYNISMSKTTLISLVPTSTSTEPPLINALEVFQISDYKVTYTVESSNSASPPETNSSSSDDDTPPSTPSDDDTPPSSSDDDTPTSFSSTRNSGSTSSKKKSKLPVILGAGIPVFMLVAAFVAVMVLMQQKRKKAVMAAGAAGGNNNGQLGYNNGQNQNQMMNDAAKLGQGVLMNEFKVNVEDNNNNGDQYHDMADRGLGADLSPYGSPAPLLNNSNNNHI